MGVGWRLRKTALCSVQCKEFLCAELEEKVSEILVGIWGDFWLKKTNDLFIKIPHICAKELILFEGLKHGGIQVKLLCLQDLGGRWLVSARFSELHRGWLVSVSNASDKAKWRCVRTAPSGKKSWHWCHIFTEYFLMMQSRLNERNRENHNWKWKVLEAW